MRLSDINLNALFVFTVLGRTRSLAGAARELGTQKSTVSRQLSKLEDDVGARLVQRTSRKWALTKAGERFLLESQRVVDAARQALGSVQSVTEEPTGLLRVTAPVIFGQAFLGPLVATFLSRFPKAQVSVALTDRVVDLVDEGIDVAIRIGPLADSSLVRRRIASLEPVCCASRSYLATRGVPKEPAALTAHDCIVWNERAPTATWRFRGPTGSLSVEVAGRASADNAVLQLQWAQAGLGVALLPRFLAHGPLQAGELVELFPGRTIAFAGVVALYPSGRLLSPAVRAFVDLVATSFPAGRAGA